MQASLFKDEQILDPLEAELRRQVEEHKYFINQSLPHEITMEEAFESWGSLVYGPLSSAIDEEGLDKEFSDVSEDELFLKISRHWHYMKNGGTINVSPREAVLDYGSLFAKREDSRFDYQLKKLFL